MPRLHLLITRMPRNHLRNRVLPLLAHSYILMNWAIPFPPPPLSLLTTWALSVLPKILNTMVRWNTLTCTTTGSRMWLKAVLSLQFTWLEVLCLLTYSPKPCLELRWRSSGWWWACRIKGELSHQGGVLNFDVLVMFLCLFIPFDFIYGLCSTQGLCSTFSRVHSFSS